jgi:choline dehydrogenase-like flavoprotein
VGGRSLVWGRQCYRWSDLDFEANAKDGHGVDWPIRYKDLEPWYDYVEPFVGISGSVEHIPQLPDSKFLPPMQFNAMEAYMSQKWQAIYGANRKMIIGRVANHTEKVGDRGPCQYRNRCEQGCPFGGYFSSNSATLPAAAKTGNLTLRPHSIVTEVLYDKESKRATGVRILDTETLQTEEYYARIVFLNASTINTAWILLHSTSDVFPNGFGNSSGQVGHNLMDHHLGAGAGGQLDMFADKYYYGRKANICYLPRFRNINVASKHPDFVRGYAFHCSAGRGGWGHHVDGESIGPAFKEAISEPGIWHLDMAGFGETLPYYNNKVTLDNTRKDKWGLPVIAIDCQANDNEWKMRTDEVNTAAEMLDKIGAKNISTRNSKHVGERVFSVHDMGVARMGRDPKTSVLNGNNQMHDAQNVFITDGSCMASSACQNPSLTYMALTARACDFAVKELKKGNL